MGTRRPSAEHDDVEIEKPVNDYSAMLEGGGKYNRRLSHLVEAAQYFAYKADQRIVANSDCNGIEPRLCKRKEPFQREDLVPEAKRRPSIYDFDYPDSEPPRKKVIGE